MELFNKILIPAIFVALLLCLPATGQVSYNGKELRIQHELFQKQINIPDRGAGPVRIASLLDSDGQNLLSETKESAYFEFVLDHQKITSLDPFWRYQKHAVRKLDNGGTEVVITVHGIHDQVKGLIIDIAQQYFPGTTLMREMITLRATGSQQFKLNKLDGKLHFVFPQYSIQSNQLQSATEIRLASWASELVGVDHRASADERFPGGSFSDHNLAYNHMFHPRQLRHQPAQEYTLVKGPIHIVNTGDLQWISAYEHASQDDLRGLFKSEKVAEGGIILDASQGTNGVFDFPVSARDFQFLGISQSPGSVASEIAVKAVRGAYLDDEVIDSAHPYTSVWTATSFDRDTSAGRAQEILHDYMWRCICERPASRIPEFYYNTWGMQRRLNSQGHDLRGVLTEDKIKEEIEMAAEIGVDIFVLDDGWEQAQGIWTPNTERFPYGLGPVKEALDQHGIKMGIWLSPMGIDSSTQRYRDHPEWVIRDSEGDPIGAQWGHPAFDFVSDFYDLFIMDCKKLVDAGTRFFKWDAINTFYSTLPGLYHGSEQYPDEEIRARYEYLLPIFVTRAMKELTDYEPELVIEIDLTEARRVMTGLAPMSQGKLFWMNNGASGYNDYSSYRAKSMRSIPNQYAGIIPYELFTYANYPQSSGKSMRYNLNTSLVAGHGFWGALEETSPEERELIGKTVRKCKRVLPYIAGTIPQVIGRVGSSPEIYTLVNMDAGAGQIIAFSGSALHYRHSVKLMADPVLGVLNHAYTIKEGELILDFSFPMPESTREAFVIPNLGTGISIVSSSCWLDELSFKSGTLSFINGAPGEQEIVWDAEYGKPDWQEAPGLKIEVEQSPDSYLLHVSQSVSETEVHIMGSGGGNR